MLVCAVLLAGGTSRRFAGTVPGPVVCDGPPSAVGPSAGGAPGGVGKVAARLAEDGPSLLEHVLLGLPVHWPVVVVGTADALGTSRRVQGVVDVVREDPPSGGPAAAALTGLVRAVDLGADAAVVVAADMPFAGPVAQECVRVLAGAGEEVDAVLPVDGHGREQPLAGAYRPARVLSRVARSGLSGPAEWTGAPVRRVVSALRWRPLDPASAGASTDLLLDVDTHADLARARELWARHA